MAPFCSWFMMFFPLFHTQYPQTIGPGQKNAGDTSPEKRKRELAENKRTIQKVRLHTGAPLSPHYDHYRSPSHFFASNRCYNISEICPLGFVYFCPIHVLLCSAL